MQKRERKNANRIMAVCIMASYTLRSLIHHLIAEALRLHCANTVCVTLAGAGRSNLHRVSIPK